MKMLTRISILILTLATFACDSLVQDVDLDKLPSTDSKLVVQCFISPQSPYITAIVTESAPYFAETVKEGDLVIENAIVTISDGQNEIQIPFDPETRLYALDAQLFPVKAGIKYFLKVTDGKRTISGESTIPRSLVPLKDFELTYNIDSTIPLNAYQYPEVSLKMYWDDIKEEPNYYRVSAYLVYSFNGYTWDPDTQTPGVLRAQEKRVFSWDDDFGKNVFQSDINIEGSAFSSPRGYTSVVNSYNEIIYEGKSLIFKSDTKIEQVSMSILNADEAYYKYHRSIENSNNDNPFAEPSLIYSNITGGLGCFASYNMSTKEYRP